MRGRPARTTTTPPRPDDRAAAEAAALRILGRASQSTAGLRRRLVSSGFDEGTSEAAATAMAAHGYIDDAALADSVSRRRTRGGYGRARIAADLRSRGIGPADVAATIEAIDGDEEAGRAFVVAATRWPLRPGEDPRHRHGRVGAVLQRRGFGVAVITQVLRALSENGAERAPDHPEGGGPPVQ